MKFSLLEVFNVLMVHLTFAQACRQYAGADWDNFSSSLTGLMFYHYEAVGSEELEILPPDQKEHVLFVLYLHAYCASPSFLHSMIKFYKNIYSNHGK